MVELCRVATPPELCPRWLAAAAEATPHEQRREKRSVLGPQPAPDCRAGDAGWRKGDDSTSVSRSITDRKRGMISVAVRVPR